MTESGRGPKDSNGGSGQLPKADSQPPRSTQAAHPANKQQIQQGVSPYQGAASAVAGSVHQRVQPQSPGHTRVNPNLPGVSMHPHVVAALAKEQEDEERLKAEKLASLNFLERLSLSFTITWAYKSNIIGPDCPWSA